MANGTNLSGRNRTRKPRVQNPIESRQNQLLQYGIGKDTQYDTDTPFGLKPPETKLGESTINYLGSPSEAAKQLKKAQLEAINQNIFDAEEAIGGGFSPDTLKNLQAKPSGPKADQLVIDAETSEKNKKATAEGEAIFDAKQQIRGAESDALDKLFEQSMEDYLTNVRGVGPETRTKDLEEYKREFAEATGIDISGKVDKSAALMSLGLAMMQNRAGRGFNVGRLFSEFGKAGEAALPALEKAKTQARNDAIAAGKYALQTRASDRATDAANQEKLMNRGKYWIYKKGGKGEEFSEFDNGEFVDLNKFELNKLVNNPDFDKNYEFIDASDRLSILEKRAEGQDLGDMWESYERVSLIGGKADEMPPELQVLAAAADSNYKGTTPTRYKLAEDPRTVARRFAEYQQDINSGTKKMQDLLTALDGGVTIPEQFLSKANEILVGFGIGETSTITDAKRELKNIAIDRATEILRESGKTLSDRDRELVIQRIGKISWGSADVGQIRKQLEDIYDLTVLKPQRNLDRAIEWLDVNAGITFGATKDDMPTQDEIDKMNEVYGTNLTMDDFKK